MCGIVGLINGHPVARDLIGALERLEYRGYDSAGIALSGSGLVVRKVVGRAAALADALGEATGQGRVGIAHTRWATHGRADVRNAHPHVCDEVAVVHNGIIENHAALRAHLVALGHSFHSDTDSEVVPHLIAEARRSGASHMEAVRYACGNLKGAYAIAVVFGDAPDRILVARQGSPLVVGVGEDTAALSSDPAALAGLCPMFAALDDGDIAELTSNWVRIADAEGCAVSRPWQPVIAEADQGNGGAFTHATRREIAQQAVTVRRTDDGLRDSALPDHIAAATRLTIVACGSSLYAAATARPWLEGLGGVPCDIEVASEFRYREAPLAPGSVAVMVSQSGETADTLANLPRFRDAGIPVVAVVNMPHSTLARAADLVWPTRAGRETGVAATKSFTAQLVALLRMAIALGRARGADEAKLREAEEALAAAPAACAATEELELTLAAVARRIAKENEAMFIGRSAGAALAAEGALKLKELSYIRSEAYPAGELKHGPIALIREHSPVIVCAGDRHIAKTVGSAEEVRARGADVIALTGASNAAAFAEVARTVVPLPGEGISLVFAQTVALQLIAYHAAVALERDVDRPRNLAKSVTVE